MPISTQKDPKNLTRNKDIPNVVFFKGSKGRKISSCQILTPELLHHENTASVAPRSDVNLNCRPLKAFIDRAGGKIWTNLTKLNLPLYRIVWKNRTDMISAIEQHELG